MLRGYALVILACVYLDGHMGQAGDAGETRFVGRGRLLAVRHHRRDQASVTGPEPPKMQVAHAVAIDFEPLADGAGKVPVRHHAPRPADRIRPNDQLRITPTPTSAISGSMKTQA